MNNLEGPIDTGIFLQALRQIIDPEVGLDIVELGLIYRLDTNAEGVQLDMTMTSAACPMSEGILAEVETALAACLPAGARIEVRLVWEPPWSPELMSEEAREHFGWELSFTPSHTRLTFTHQGT